MNSQTMAPGKKYILVAATSEPDIRQLNLWGLGTDTNSTIFSTNTGRWLVCSAVTNTPVIPANYVRQNVYIYE